MVLRLTAGIVALVFLLLGATFLILGFLPVGDEAGGFRATGAGLFGAGLVCAAVFTVLHRRAAAERRRRREGRRATAEIVEARLHPYTRIGVMLTYTLTIRYPAAGLGDRTFSRQVLLPPTFALRKGQSVDVLHDPADPGNFEPVEPGS